MRIVPPLVLLLALLAGSSLSAQSGDIQAFWTEFRQAIKNNDKDKVAAMTRFPFKTRGQTDSDPVKTHNKVSFLKIWDKLMQADPGLGPDADTMRRFVERKPTITSEASASEKGSARVGNFVFDRVQGKWLFTMAFLDE
jgi:hypothetical protein